MSREAANEIAAFFAQDIDTLAYVVCETCEGYGAYIAHEDECYDTGGCVCGGTEVECPDCRLEREAT